MALVLTNSGTALDPLTTAEMEMKNLPLLLGPYFTLELPPESWTNQIVPLSLAMEWSHAFSSTKIHLFRRHRSFPPNRIRLEEILFQSAAIPCEVECLDYQVVETSDGVFLPLEALLATLYRNGRVCRSIFQVLDDLAGAIPIHSSLSNQIRSTCLLIPEAESRGFRLNAIFQEPGRTLANVVWESSHRGARFHTSTAGFALSPDKFSEWIPQIGTGLSHVLESELRTLVPGDPMNLLTKAGFALLVERGSQTPLTAALPG